MAGKRKPWDIQPLGISASSIPDAAQPSFEQKFAKMEFVGDGKFALYFMRYTGEWVGIHDSMSVDESMVAIQDDEWFSP